MRHLDWIGIPCILYRLLFIPEKVYIGSKKKVTAGFSGSAASL